jgi:hypothetical protein
MSPFKEDEEAHFFGRKWETRELADLIMANRVMHVCSQSGTGKTSLIRAGVLPLLARCPDFEVLPIVRVGRLPLEQVDRKRRQRGLILNLYPALGSFTEPTKLTNLSLNLPISG